jgi:hypothetical protein
MFNIIFAVQVIDHMFITTDLLLHDYRGPGKIYIYHELSGQNYRNLLKFEYARAGEFAEN